MSISTHTAQPEYIDAKQFEAIFSLSRRLYWQWIKDEKIAAYRPCARRTLVRRQDVERILEASKAGADLDSLVDETVREVLGR